jgi:dihydrofolate reductase
MLLSLIAAIDRWGLIGDETGLPWHLPKDLRRFRAYTWGKPIIMGRKTFEHIGKPLPGRFSIVLTQNPSYSAPGCQVARTMQEALSIAQDHLTTAGGNEAVIIGGGKVYAEAIHRWDRLYLTLVEGKFQGSTYFPIRELLQQSWRPASAPESHSPDEKNAHAHTFYILESSPDARRRSPQPKEGNHIHECAHAKEALEGANLATILARGTIGL